MMTLKDAMKMADDLRPLRNEGIAATRQLAKRQLTWLRSMPQRQVIDCLSPDAARQVRERIVRLG